MNGIECWKVVTWDRKSCIVDGCDNINMRYSLNYPVNKWVRPIQGTKIFAFNSMDCAKEFQHVIGWAVQGTIIVPALGKHPSNNRRIVILSSYTKPNNMAEFWNNTLATYWMKEVPLGTRCFGMLKCLE